MADNVVHTQVRWAKTVTSFFAQSSYIITILQEQSKVPLVSKTEEVDSEDILKSEVLQAGDQY